MGAFTNDGSVQANTRVLTINSVAYIAESWSVDREAKVLTRTNELDEVNGHYAYAGDITGSAVLQLASAATVIPRQGYEFTVTTVTGIGAETFFLTRIGQAEAQGEIKKVTVDFIKKAN